MLLAARLPLVGKDFMRSNEVWMFGSFEGYLVTSSDWLKNDIFLRDANVISSVAACTSQPLGCDVS